MVKLLTPQAPYNVLIRKKFGYKEFGSMPSTFGEAIFGDTNFGNIDVPKINPNYGIYQVRHCKEGLRSVRMRFYTPYNPQTVPQQANRSKFALAVSAWQVLTLEQKKVYHKRATGKHLSGYNLFLREYMLS
jgi:hypothetical protein